MNIRLCIPVLAIASIAAFAASAQSQQQNLATKMSALQKACAAGVFSQAECNTRRQALMQQMMGNQGGGNTAGGGMAGMPAMPAMPAMPPPLVQGGIFHDPQGRFSTSVPDGWNVNDNNGNAQLSSGPAWVMLIPAPGSNIETETSNVVHQIQSQYQTLNQTNSGRPTINGHSAVYAVFSGTTQKGEQVALMAAGVSAPGGHVLVFVSSAPLAQINSFSPNFLKVLNGIHFPGDK